MRFLAGVTIKSGLVTGSGGTGGTGKSVPKILSLANGRGVPRSSYLAMHGAGELVRRERGAVGAGADAPEALLALVGDALAESFKSVVDVYRVLVAFHGPPTGSALVARSLVVIGVDGRAGRQLEFRRRGKVLQNG